MKTQCPQCAVIGSVDEAYLGKKVKCPKCGEKFVVSDASTDSSGSPPAPSPPPLPEVAATHEPGQGVELEEIVSTHVLGDDLSSLEDALPSPEAVSSLSGEEEPAELPAEPMVDQVSAEPSALESGTPQPEPEETIDWADIVSEMDEKQGEEEQRGLEEDAAPAGLDHGLEDSSGAAVTGGVEVPGNDALEVEVDDTSRLVAAEPHPEREIPLAAAAGVAGAALAGWDDKRETTEKIVLDEVEQHPYGMEKEQCWQCGKKDSVGMPFIAKDGRLYCPDCLPAEPSESSMESAAPRQPRYGFTIGGLLREAWDKTKGVKGAIWAGSAIMYVAMIIIVAGGTLVLPYGGSGGWNPVGMVADLLLQLVTNAVVVIFSAGLINIGIRKVAGEAVGWRMVFDGFPVAGKLVIACILQTLLVLIGFLLLILPGIYLSVGYCMTIPLIIDRKMSPWQAMEASRKAVHGEWWKIFGLFLVMGLLCLIASLPLGLGLIWVWPMVVVLGALVYRSLFGIARKAD